MLEYPTTAELGTAIDDLVGTDGKRLPGVDVPQPLPAIGGVESSPESLPAAPEAPYQVMPRLTSEEYDSLKSDIELRGIQVPILVDEQGQIIDGHHRKQIADCLGIECPTDRREGLTEVQKRELAVVLNIERRHLTREQRQNIIDECLLAAPDKSDRHIAKVAGVSDKTVAKKRRELESRSEIPAPTSRIDMKGRLQPARKGRSENPNVNKQASPPTLLPPAKVVEAFKANCLAIRQCHQRGDLTASDAYEIASRLLSILDYAIDRLRDQERRKVLDNLQERVLAHQRAVRQIPSHSQHADDPIPADSATSLSAPCAEFRTEARPNMRQLQPPLDVIAAHVAGGHK